MRQIYWRVVRPTTFGVKVMVRYKSEILLVKHSYDRSWNLPGGAYRPKRETPESASKREIFEELGIRLSKLRLIDSGVSVKEFKKDHIKIYLAVFSSKPDLTLGHELVAAQWFRQDRLPQQTASIVKQIKN